MDDKRVRTKAIEDQYAAAVCASVLQSERIAAFNTIREHVDKTSE